jgi:subtilisin
MRQKYFLVFSLFFLFSPFIVSAKIDSEPLSQYQTYLDKIVYNQSVKNKSTGSGVVVAVIDSGVWLSHPDLKNNIWLNSLEIPQNKKDDDGNGYIDDYYGWNFVEGSSNMLAYASHGTEVASIIAAEHNDYGIAGIAPKAKIMSLTVCDEVGCSTDSIIDAIYYAVDNGANVINLSLGGDGYVGYTDLFDAPMQYAYKKGVVVVVAAGNGDVESAGSSGQDLNFIKASPVSNEIGGLNTFLGVGALDMSMQKISRWSNVGSVVDLYAPGEGIAVATVPSLNEDGYYFSYVDGTSFSAPMVSGAVALVKSKFQKLKNWEIIDKIISTTDDGKRLRVDKVLSDGDSDINQSCNIQSVSIQKNGKKKTLSVTGEHFKNSMKFRLVNRGVVPYQEKILTKLQFADAGNFTTSITKLRLPAGKYTLESVPNFGNCKTKKGITVQID